MSKGEAAFWLIWAIVIAAAVPFVIREIIRWHRAVRAERRALADLRAAQARLQR